MRPLRFRIVALVAAYALALHAQLAFAVAPVGAAMSLSGLCSGLASDQDGTPPAGHDISCAMACALLGANIAPVEPIVAAIATPVVALVLHPVTEATPRRALFEGSPRARAPPLA